MRMVEAVILLLLGVLLIHILLQYMIPSISFLSEAVEREFVYNVVGSYCISNSTYSIDIYVVEPSDVYIRSVAVDNSFVSPLNMTYVDGNYTATVFDEKGLYRIYLPVCGEDIDVLLSNGDYISL